MHYIPDVIVVAIVFPCLSLLYQWCIGQPLHYWILILYEHSDIIKSCSWLAQVLWLPHLKAWGPNTVCFLTELRTAAAQIQSFQLVWIHGAAYRWAQVQGLLYCKKTWANPLHCIVGLQHKDNVSALDGETESVLKFDTFQSTRIVQTCRTPSRTHFFTAAELWLIQRCFSPHPVADLIRSIYAIQQCSLSLPLRLDLLPSITNVMFSLPHSFLFLYILVLCFFSHTALWLFTHFSSSLPAWGKWAYR